MRDAMLFTSYRFGICHRHRIALSHAVTNWEQAQAQHMQRHRVVYIYASYMHFCDCVARSSTQQDSSCVMHTLRGAQAPSFSLLHYKVLHSHKDLQRGGLTALLACKCQPNLD